MLCQNPNCGKEIENDSQFCIHCGNKLTIPELGEEPREGEESTFQTIQPANQNLENPKGERGKGVGLIFVGVALVMARA